MGNEAHQVYGFVGASLYLDIKQPTVTTTQNVQVFNNNTVSHDLWSWFDYLKSLTTPLTLQGKGISNIWWRDERCHIVAGCLSEECQSTLTVAALLSSFCEWN